VNSLLPVIGALVVEEGGAICHAAIVPREFGLPAVIGAHGATTRIPDGAHVQVDPQQGAVRLLYVTRTPSSVPVRAGTALLNACGLKPNAAGNRTGIPSAAK
jgi:phosphoenolpyruvate-protein kinase (PTS system EI component)